MEEGVHVQAGRILKLGAARADRPLPSRAEILRTFRAVSARQVAEEIEDIDGLPPLIARAARALDDFIFASVEFEDAVAAMTILRRSGRSGLHADSSARGGYAALRATAAAARQALLDRTDELIKAFDGGLNRALSQIRQFNRRRFDEIRALGMALREIELVIEIASFDGGEGMRREAREELIGRAATVLALLRKSRRVKS